MGLYFINLAQESSFYERPKMAKKKRYYDKGMSKSMPALLPEERKTMMMGSYSDGSVMYNDSVEQMDMQMNADRRDVMKQKPKGRY